MKAPEEIAIAADNQFLFSVLGHGGILEACLALLATYYVFMIKYPSTLNNFFLYMQRCILNIQDAKKLPSAILTFVNDLSHT